MTARMNPRDALTLRIARTLAETRRDPWAYSEGAHEPQLLDCAPHRRTPFDPTRLGHRVALWLGVVGLCIVVPLIALGRL
jgi:hypothetical protein